MSLGIPCRITDWVLVSWWVVVEGGGGGGQHQTLFVDDL